MTENSTAPDLTTYYRQPLAQAPAGVPGQWSATPVPASSGYRVTAGIVAIVFSFVLSAQFFVALAGGGAPIALLISLASLGNLVSGIVILVLHNQRLGNAPKVVLGMALFGIVATLLGAFVPVYGPMVAVVGFLLAIVILEATSRGMTREKQTVSA